MTAKEAAKQRLEQALGCIGNPSVRLKIRRIFYNEMHNASIFWDERDRQVELIADDVEIIIRERDGATKAPAK